jgi:hypothetical protein
MPSAGRSLTRSHPNAGAPAHHLLGHRFIDRTKRINAVARSVWVMPAAAKCPSPLATRQDRLQVVAHIELDRQPLALGEGARQFDLIADTVPSSSTK